MDSTIPTLSRQSGLLQAAQVISNNIANASTIGYKSEGVIFSEHITAGGNRRDSLSMGHLTAHSTNFQNGGFKRTGGELDFALSGPGFFKVEAEDGERLTRAGSFVITPEGTLTDPQGNAVLDDAGGQIVFPPDRGQIEISREGTISAGGEQIATIGVYKPIGEALRAGNNMWVAPEGDEPVEAPVVIGGALEQSNVSPVQEFAKLIEVQRAFEANQSLFQQEHDRLSALIAAIRLQG